MKSCTNVHTCEGTGKVCKSYEKVHKSGLVNVAIKDSCIVSSHRKIVVVGLHYMYYVCSCVVHSVLSHVYAVYTLGDVKYSQLSLGKRGDEWMSIMKNSLSSVPVLG